MSDDVKALAGKLRRYARSLEEWEEYEVEAWSDGTSLTTLELTQAADALEAAQLEPVYGDYLEGLEEGMTDGIKIGQAEAAQQAPAVYREALARYFYMDNSGWEESAVEHWKYLIERIHAGKETGHDKWLCFQVADQLIASGILLDAAEVEARGLEKAAEVTDALTPGGQMWLRARAQQVREGNA